MLIQWELSVRSSKDIGGCKQCTFASSILQADFKLKEATDNVSFV